MIDRPGDDLVARARAGDHHAFGLLLRDHDDRMRGLAYRMMGSGSAMDDVLQDAYLKAFQSLHRFRGDASFATWLNRIVANTCIDHCRRRNRRPVVPLDVDELPLPDRSAGAEQRLSERSVIDQALAALPPAQRIVVLLVDGEELSYEETADLLGTRPGTIASRLSRARATLRVSLGAPSEEGPR